MLCEGSGLNGFRFEGYWLRGNRIYGAYLEALFEF